MPRLKSWESPRKEGIRNHKGKGGAAKKKQWQKRLKMLKSKLKNTDSGEVQNFPFFCLFFHTFTLSYLRFG